MGYVLTADGVNPDPKKVEAIIAMPTSQSGRLTEKKKEEIQNTAFSFLDRVLKQVSEVFNVVVLFSGTACL